METNLIKGEKVVLRPLHQGDFQILYKWINDPEIMKLWYGRDKPRSKEWVEKHFTSILEEKDPSQCWTIEVEGKPIGYIYNTPEKDGDTGEFNGRIELDILIGEKDEWNKGYGTDALLAMVNHAFSVQKAERVWLTPRSSNPRAIHVYEKVGFKQEGILRHFEKFEGKWINCVMMSLLKDEFHHGGK